MANKHYEFEIAGEQVKVEAEEEGNARYMVRMLLPGNVRIRIGYLTGAKQTWLAEFFSRPAKASQPAKSAKDACRALAEFAMSQPPASVG